MKSLLIIRNNLQKIYASYGLYINKAAKFVLALITFFMISKNLGYFEPLTNPIVLLVLALVCMFLPLNFTIVIAGIMLLLHLYKLSLEALLICGVILIVAWLIYMRVVPKQAVVVLLVPLAFALKIPYVIPIALGLACTPIAMVSSAFGIFVYYMVKTLIAYGATTTAVSIGEEAMDTVSKLSNLMKSVVINKEMFVYMLGFAVVILVVYIIRRIGFPFCWIAAIVVGLILNFVAFTMLGSKLGVTINGGELVMGSLVALVVALILHWFLFTVDYSSTKKVQFEDDDYYYYVKAVPKMKVSTPKRRMKTIIEEDDPDDLPRQNEDYSEFDYEEDSLEPEVVHFDEEPELPRREEYDDGVDIDAYEDIPYDASAYDDDEFFDDGDYAEFYSDDDFEDDPRG